jgi:N-acetylmuramoyl-L-alanine amidase
LGKQNVILVTIHVNAAGNGSKWLNATGWSRTDISDVDMDWEEGFYILRKSLCPVVLTENFFMDSRDDVEYLCSK